MRVFLTVFLTFYALVTGQVFGQTSSSAGIFHDLPDGLKINAYVDMYYASDNVEGNYLRQFSAIAPYRDDFKLNFVSLAARYANDNFRGNVVIHYGDVPDVNWPVADKFIQEANIGYKPCKNFWIDAGYFITHIGGEGLLPKYNPLTIISLCTTLEPWYQSGIRLSYDFSDKLSAQIHLVNSFNAFTDSHKHKSGGIQIDYKPTSKIELIYNNLLGKENTLLDNNERFRFYNNLVIKINPSKKTNLILTADHCYQEKSKISDPNSAAHLFSGFATLKYFFNKNFSVAARGEYYIDKDGILSGIFNADSQSVGLNAYGFTLGLEYDPVEFGFVRLESRYLKADSNIFYNHKKNRTEGVLSIGAEF